MNYNTLLVPLKKEQIEFIKSDNINTISHSISIAKEDFEWEWLQQFDACLVTFKSNKTSSNYDSFRQKFYSLYVSQKKIKLVDLGDYIYDNDNREDTERKLYFLAEKIFTYKLFPIIISPEVHWGFIFNKLHTLLSHLRNQAIIIHHANNIAVKNQSEITLNNLIHTVKKIICKEKFDTLSILGFQTHKTNPEDLIYYAQNYIETLRLGLLRNNIEIAEPLLRHVHCLTVDMSVIRYADFTATTICNPNGLFSENLCELVYFATVSKNLKSLIFTNFEIEKLVKNDASLFAEVLWYSYDGLSNRIDGDSFLSTEIYNKHIVDIDLYTTPIYFYQNRITNHWWIELDDINGSKQYIPCLQEDYQQTIKGELSDRWLWNLKKYNQK